AALAGDPRPEGRQGIPEGRPAALRAHRLGPAPAATLAQPADPGIQQAAAGRVAGRCVADQRTAGAEPEAGIARPLVQALQERRLRAPDRGRAAAALAATEQTAQE